MTDKDLIILGAGPGGYTAAIKAAELGRQVTLVEQEALGGTCLNWGCIPTKALIASAELVEKIKKSSEFGIQVDNYTVNFPTIIERSREVVAKLNSGIQHLMKKGVVEVIKGRGCLLGNNTLKIETAKSVLEFKYQDIILAIGGQPATIPGINIDTKLIHSSRTILESKTLPGKILITGAGAIGVEFAYLFNALGSEVTLIDLADKIIPFEDSALSKNLTRFLKGKGISIKTSASLSSVSTEQDSVSASIKTSQNEESWKGNCLLLATGVKPNTSGVGVENTGIEMDGPFIKTDSLMKTNIEHHFAIGDITGAPLLAHKASHEALIAAEAVCGKTSLSLDKNLIPSCIYCKPQIASIGLSTDKAKKAGLEVKTGRIPFSAIGKAVATGETEGFCQVVIEKETDKLLGVQIIHDEATELITGAAYLLQKKASAHDIIETIHPHPTLAEALFEATSLALNK